MLNQFNLQFLRRFAPPLKAANNINPQRKTFGNQLFFLFNLFFESKVEF